MSNDGGPDDATVNEEAPDSAAEARTDQEGKTPADATELRRDAKEDIARAAAAEPERHEAQQGPKATPTQHDANAATAAGTPSREAQEAFRRKLEQEQDAKGESGGGESGERRTAKDMVTEGVAPLAPLPGRAEPADQDTASPADPADAEELQEHQEQVSQDKG